MKKREIKNGFVQCDNLNELRKLFLLDDEATVLGLAVDQMADVFYYTPSFREITSAIEECYADTANSNCSTYKLDDNYSVILKVLPAAKGCNKGLAMSLVNNDNNEIYKLVKYINVSEPCGQDTAHSFMVEFMTDWITNMSRDIIHSSLFCLYEQTDETVRQMVVQA